MKKFVLFCFLVTVTFGYADDTKISPELRGYNSTQQVQVIVQYAPGTQPGGQTNCGGLFGFLDCVVSDLLNILGQLPLINGVVALVDGTGIVNLSNQANVVYISPDRQLSTLDNAPSAVNAEVAWQSNYIGTGIGVALIDSGVNSHPDFYTGLLRESCTTSPSCPEHRIRTTSTATEPI
jgi:subtilisin family serine protease